jgi:predicted enzyme related to lactoylglutathione lyase
MGNRVVHFEILGKDRDALSGFYRDIFDWQIEPIPGMPYAMVDPAGGEGAIAGGIGEPQDGEPLVTFYIEVPSIDDTLQRIEQAGGSTVMPRTELGMVTIAMFTDPEGHRIGLVESGSGEDEDEDEDEDREGDNGSEGEDS